MMSKQVNTLKDLGINKEGMSIGKKVINNKITDHPSQINHHP
jgi:hypothetical protein